MKYLCRANFSYAESKYFKGETYEKFPPQFAHVFEEVKTKKAKVATKEVETAAVEPKQKRKKKS